MEKTRARLAGPIFTFVAAVLFAGAVAWMLRSAWNPPLRTYLDYVPIGAVFAAFFWDRLFPAPPSRGQALRCDALAIMLAVMRVFVPPLPFVSGHALFAAYATLTPRGWALRVLAFAVLAHVVYDKVLATGGIVSMVGGLAVAFVLARVRGRDHD